MGKNNQRFIAFIKRYIRGYLNEGKIYIDDIWEYGFRAISLKFCNGYHTSCIWLNRGYQVDLE